MKMSDDFLKAACSCLECDGLIKLVAGTDNRLGDLDRFDGVDTRTFDDQATLSERNAELVVEADIYSELLSTVYRTRGLQLDIWVVHCKGLLLKESLTGLSYLSLTEYSDHSICGYLIQIILSFQSHLNESWSPRKQLG